MMPPDLYAMYTKNPLAADHLVRARLKVPENRYYVVTTWPQHLAGRVFVDPTRTRVVKAHKVSKSDSHASEA